MTAPNHAVMGALLGLGVDNPVLAASFAFLSHFVLDAMPHYDPPGKNELRRLASGRFFRELMLQALLCLLLVILLAGTRPQHWLLATLCAFLACVPDLLWLPKFILVKRSHRLPARPNLFWRFHHSIQWCTGPQLLCFELIWFIATGGLLMTRL